MDWSGFSRSKACLDNILYFCDDDCIRRRILPRLRGDEDPLGYLCTQTRLGNTPTGDRVGSLILKGTANDEEAKQNLEGVDKAVLTEIFKDAQGVLIQSEARLLPSERWILDVQVGEVCIQFQDVAEEEREEEGNEEENAGSKPTSHEPDIEKAILLDGSIREMDVEWVRHNEKRACARIYRLRTGQEQWLGFSVIHCSDKDEHLRLLEKAQAHFPTYKLVE